RQGQKAAGGQRRECPQLKELESRPDWTQVTAAVASVRGLKWDQLQRCRGDWGRDLGWYFGRKECGLSLKALGKVSGGTDYATVSAGIKRIERRLGEDSALAQKAHCIQARIGEF